ncbi:MAG: PAS domain S-box protein [Deltaproteobacteria bacterium]|uniref:PAS domain S-box protein n=1 Tax=Candidatus Zymogenus saltonus TaxID=2844893 RepID=A0A9D8KGV8_9DELT|nr:PAS domain S-box protein [Candidatus Zymogenus saltonus]
MAKEQKYDVLTSIEIPDNTGENWTKILDLIAKIINVPVALIMRVHDRDIGVFAKSSNVENIYKEGETAELNTGLYCETVMDTQRELLVQNALKDPKWSQNPDIELGMISYLGLPLFWPTGQIFGTICVLDKKENPYSDLYRELLGKFRDAVQINLENIYNQELLTKEISERRLIEKERLKIEEKFRDLYENAPNAYFSVGTDSIIHGCNRRAEELIGCSREELIGQPVFMLYADSPGGKAKAEQVFKKFIAGEKVNDVELKMRRHDNTEVWVSLSVNTIIDKDGGIVESRSMVVDVTDRKRIEEERDRLINELQKALSEVKKLSGLLPICANCKKIRDDEGYWRQIEQYIGERSEAEFTHGICPDCAVTLYPERDKENS